MLHQENISFRNDNEIKLFEGVRSYYNGITELEKIAYAFISVLKEFGKESFNKSEFQRLDEIFVESIKQGDYIGKIELLRNELENIVSQETSGSTFYDLLSESEKAEVKNEAEHLMLEIYTIVNKITTIIEKRDLISRSLLKILFNDNIDEITLKELSRNLCYNFTKGQYEHNIVCYINKCCQLMNDFITDNIKTDYFSTRHDAWQMRRNINLDIEKMKRRSKECWKFFMNPKKGMIKKEFGYKIV